MNSTALILGVAGQDGTLLARQLLAAGRRVVGTVRPGSSLTRAPYLHGVEIVAHDVRDAAGFAELLRIHRPDEVYNLAGFTSVARSWQCPEIARAVNFEAVEIMIEALLRWRDATGVAPRFFQASSSEVFGPDSADALNERTELDPRNPYGLSKALAQLGVQNAREAEGLHASVGILFNHESPLRGTGFVTGKITRAAAEIAAGTRTSVVLGNLDVSRDWGWADDYVAAMPLIVGRNQPSDFVLASGQRHTLAELLESAFAGAGVDDPWSYVEQDVNLMRQVDSPGLLGDAGRAERELGWHRTIEFDAMITHMVAADIVRVRTGIEENPAFLPACGHAASVRIA